jgi:hypothetical protein
VPTQRLSSRLADELTLPTQLEPLT